MAPLLVTVWSQGKGEFIILLRFWFSYLSLKALTEHRYGEFDTIVSSGSGSMLDGTCAVGIGQIANWRAHLICFRPTLHLSPWEHASLSRTVCCRAVSSLSTFFTRTAPMYPRPISLKSSRLFIRQTLSAWSYSIIKHSMVVAKARLLLWSMTTRCLKRNLSPNIVWSGFV